MKNNKNVKQIEKFMMLNSRRANPEYEQAFDKMVTVMRFFDITQNTCHCKTIDALYNVEKKIYTYVRLASELSTNDNSLRHSRRMYTQLFMYFLRISEKKYYKNAVKI